MGVADRLYEASCECRDLEEANDRLRRELTEKDREIRALKRQLEEVLGGQSAG